MEHRLVEPSANIGEDVTSEEAMLLLEQAARSAVKAGHHPAQVMVAAMMYAQGAFRGTVLDVAEASAVRH